jgi:outer membrane biosynthesis protein TonB
MISTRARTAATDVGSAFVSIWFHVLLIAIWFVASLRHPVIEPISDRGAPIYILAPDRMVARAGATAADQRVVREAKKPSSGEVRRPSDKVSRDTAALAQDAQRAERNRTATAASVTAAGNDSVYSVLEVDSAVTRSPSSAAPQYPPVLVAAHIQGYVTVRYVVDTSGLADTSTFVVLESTNPAFIGAVRDALPGMRFTAAMVGSRKVRQTVEQEFLFRLESTAAAFGRP